MGEDQNERTPRTYLSFDVNTPIGKKIRMLRLAGFKSEQIVTKGYKVLMETNQYKDFIKDLMNGA